MNNKKKFDIQDAISKVEKGLFDEDLVKSFLITIREHVKNKFLREICDFIAHSRRDRGFCSDEINKKYFQLRYANLPPHKPVKFDVFRINKKEFEIFLSIINVNNDKKRLKSFYKKNGNYYEIKSLNDLNNINRIVQCYMRSIEVNYLASGAEIVKYLNDFLIKFYEQHQLQSNFKIEGKCAQEVMICIFSILQDIEFILYDDQEAKGEIQLSKQETLNFYGVFPVPYMETKFAIPIIALTDISISEFTNQNLELGVLKTFKVNRENKVLLLKFLS